MGDTNQNICINMDTKLIFQMYNIISFYINYKIDTTNLLHLDYNGVVSEVRLLL